MKHPLIQVIDNIQFENKHKYTIKLNFMGFSGGHFYLHVDRMIICSIRQIPLAVGNGCWVSASITEDELVKTIFERVGQFEAHEFCESFRYKEVAAYFPHDTGMDKNVPYLYGKSNRINNMLLEPWTDITKSKTDFEIASRYLGRWYRKTGFFKTKSEIVSSWRHTFYKLKSKYSGIKWKLIYAWRKFKASLGPKTKPIIVSADGFSVTIMVDMSAATPIKNKDKVG